MAMQEKLSAGMSPQHQLAGMIWSFTKVQIIYAAAKLGIPDLLGQGPQNASVLAGALEIDPQIMFRLMRGLAWCGLVAHSEYDRFALTPLGECLQRDSPGSMYDNALSMGEIDWPAWGSFLDVIRSGKPGFVHAFGMEVFEYFTEHETAGRRFDGLMRRLSASVSEQVVGAYDFSDFSTFVDVGGGNGTLTTSILEANPRIRGILLDLPKVVERTKRFLSASKVADRCEAVGGDFFESVPPGGDVYIMKWILHDWTDERCVRILENCRDRMADEGRLLVVDRVMPEQASPSTLGVMWDLHMLVLHNGLERTETQLRTLFSSSGFELTRVIPTESGMSVVEAVPA